MAVSSGIEIVVRDCPPGRLFAWLSEVAGPLGVATDAGGAAVYSTGLGTVVVQPGAGGPASASVWFHAAVLPWATDAACARQASRALGCPVLCDPGPEYPGVAPESPVLLEVSAAGERLVMTDAEAGAAAEASPPRR